MTWYRIVAAGGFSGPIRRTPEEAWEAWENMLLRAAGSPYHGRPDLIGTARAAHAARLIAATTRRAAEAADVSATHGHVGRGRWWIPLRHATAGRSRYEETST